MVSIPLLVLLPEDLMSLHPNTPLKLTALRRWRALHQPNLCMLLPEIVYARDACLNGLLFQFDTRVCSNFLFWVWQNLHSQQITYYFNMALRNQLTMAGRTPAPSSSRLADRYVVRETVTLVLTYMYCVS